MRGIYSVAGSTLRPRWNRSWSVLLGDSGSATWSKDRVESKLREYNKYGLMQITVHEAMPGHYVQQEMRTIFSHDSPLLRNIYGNGPYVEGWRSTRSR